MVLVTLLRESLMVAPIDIQVTLNHIVTQD